MIIQDVDLCELSELGDTENLRPVPVDAFITEQRYTGQEKEMTAVVHCLRTWRHYLLGSKFVVKTDNVATSYFLMPKKLTPKQARWQAFLAPFYFVMVSRVRINSYLYALNTHSLESLLLRLGVPSVLRKVLTDFEAVPDLVGGQSSVGSLTSKAKR